MEIAGGIGQMRKLVIVDTIVGILLEQIVSLFIKPLLICVFLIECGDRRDHQPEIFKIFAVPHGIPCGALGLSYGK